MLSIFLSLALPYQQLVVGKLELGLLATEDDKNHSEGHTTNSRLATSLRMLRKYQSNWKALNTRGSKAEV